jgi:flagellar basal body-associated protein FliL
MITRKKIEKGIMSWHMILLSVVFILFLAGAVVVTYWYLLSGNGILEIFEQNQQAKQNVFVNNKHTLTNIMIEGLLQCK